MIRIVLPAPMGATAVTSMRNALLVTEEAQFLLHAGACPISPLALVLPSGNPEHLEAVTLALIPRSDALILLQPFEQDSLCQAAYYAALDQELLVFHKTSEGYASADKAFTRKDLRKLCLEYSS